MSEPRRALLGLGANLGDRLATLRSAAAAVAEADGIEPLAASGVYESAPMGPQDQGPFLNAALLVATVLSPRELLEAALAIEQRHGRVRERRWGPRTLDIDVLWVEGATVEEPGLTVPHPGLADRPFVVRPAADIIPSLILPDGRRADQAAAELDDDACLRVSGADLGWPPHPR